MACTAHCTCSCAAGCGCCERRLPPAAADAVHVPQDLGDEIVASVLGQFDEVAADDSAWHGACLALAELARRGLLLPERLPEASEVVTRALAYDVRRGAHRCAELENGVAAEGAQAGWCRHSSALGAQQAGACCCQSGCRMPQRWLLVRWLTTCEEGLTGAQQTERACQRT